MSDGRDDRDGTGEDHLFERGGGREVDDRFAGSGSAPCLPSSRPGISRN